MNRPLYPWFSVAGSHYLWGRYRLFLPCSGCFFTRLPSVCPEVPAPAGPPVPSGTCLSMDGRHHKPEESWHDGCRECYCHSGREMCALITCPVPACGSPAIHPGQCCPSCSGKSWLPSCALPKQMTSALQGLIASVTLGDTQGATLGALRGFCQPRPQSQPGAIKDLPKIRENAQILKWLSSFFCWFTQWYWSLTCVFVKVCRPNALKLQLSVWQIVY